MKFTTEELMTVAIARELRDDDVAFVGLGTGGRAFALAVGIPTAACQLARLTHAPGLSLMLGPIINPDPAQQPASYTDSQLIAWPAEAQISGESCLDCFKLGKITVSFVSASQIDPRGNLNIVAIGDAKKPDVRLVGPIAQTDHLASPARNVIVNDLTPRTFVNRVDFISGAGYLEGAGARERHGLPAQGPWRVVTNAAMFDFSEEESSLRAKWLYPGVTPDSIKAQMSFLPLGLDAAQTITPPREEELDVLRSRIDPRRLLLEGNID
jgi:glutaconate CoA-transferase subunit B